MSVKGCNELDPYILLQDLYITVTRLCVELLATYHTLICAVWQGETTNLPVIKKVHET